MVTHTARLYGRQLVMAFGIVGVSLVIALAVMAATLPAAGHTAHAATLSASNGGGACFSATVPVCTFKSQDATADFLSFSTDGCVVTDANVSVFQALTRPGNVSGQFPSLTISVFDQCHNIPLEAAGNVDFTDTITFGSNLTSAHVVGTADMVDKLSAATFSVTVDVSWQGFGPITRTIDSNHSHGATLIVNEHFNGTSRTAAASGTYSDGTTNFAASPTGFAELDNATSGSVFITPR